MNIAIHILGDLMVQRIVVDMNSLREHSVTHIPGSRPGATQSGADCWMLLVNGSSGTTQGVCKFGMI